MFTPNGHNKFFSATPKYATRDAIYDSLSLYCPQWNFVQEVSKKNGKALLVQNFVQRIKTFIIL